MHITNPLSLPDGESFSVGESDFAFFDSYSGRCECAAVLFCRGGEAEVTIDQFQGWLRSDSAAMLLPGSFLMVANRSAGFRISYCLFSPTLFSEASFRLDPLFFHRLHLRPVSRPGRNVAEGMASWFDLMRYTYLDRENLYRTTIVRNRLQNMLLGTWDRMQRFASDVPPSSELALRRMELFHRFVALVHEHCTREREVTFYADRLCISTRYLHSVVRDVAHTSPKQVIANAVVLEIKMLLQSTDLPVWEIADRLRFADESYLGRFFRRATGESPTAYRNSRK